MAGVKSYQALLAEFDDENLLPGKLKQGLIATFLYPFIKTRAWKAVGELKFSTFMDYAALYSEYSFVFCGDDGQGDLLAGEMMMHQQSNK